MEHVSKENRKPESLSRCCGWREPRKNGFRRVRLGVLLVVIGLFWYGTKAGWFSMEWFRPETFWPSVVVVVGVCMVGAGLIKAKRRNT